MNTHSLDLEASSSQYVYRADNASLSQTGDISIECWVKFESLPSVSSQVGLVTKWQHGGSGQWAYNMHIYNQAGNYRLVCQQSSDGSNLNNHSKILTGLTTGEWIHLACTVDISAHSTEFFANGVTLGSENSGTQTSIFNGTTQFRIGAFADGYYLDGLIDEVRLWSDIRTSGEILANYKKELVGNESNLVGYWKFNNSLLDETANDNDLTGSGSPVFVEDIPPPFRKKSSMLLNLL